MDAVYFLDQHCFSAPLPYSRLLDILLDRDAAALVAEEMKPDFTRVVAALIMQGDPWNARLHMLRLMVKADFRRLGLAGRLLALARRLGVGLRCETLLAPVEAGNAAGEAFLRATGFSLSEEETPYFADEREGRVWSLPLTPEPAN